MQQSEMPIAKSLLRPLVVGGYGRSSEVTGSAPWRLRASSQLRGTSAVLVASWAWRCWSKLASRRSSATPCACFSAMSWSLDGALFHPPAVLGCASSLAFDSVHLHSHAAFCAMHQPWLRSSLCAIIRNQRSHCTSVRAASPKRSVDTK